MVKIHKKLVISELNKQTKKLSNSGTSIFSLSKKERGTGLSKIIIYKLRYCSEDTCWSERFRDKVAATMIDNRNGFKFKFSDGKSIELDYAQAQYLMLLLREDRINSNWVDIIRDVKVEDKALP